ncbi:MAG: polymer-forming cytoskeletal protein [Verrucomicrobiales bacterium]|nr:polymer-forming cytoskeletal protein [Verrucomicrobiales bacterium]
MVAKGEFINPQPEHTSPAGSRKASENVLNSGVEIKGTLRFSGELTFDGKIDGEIQTDGTLHLRDSAVIKGNIHAQIVVVRGKINGNIIANDKIDIKANTELFGDIRASKLAMEEGVTFVGKTEISPKKVRPAAAPPLLPADVPKISEPTRRPGGR